MRTEYAVEVYNKADDSFEEQIDVFETYEEAQRCIEETDVVIDKDSEYFGILEIKYDENGNEIDTNRM